MHDFDDDRDRRDHPKANARLLRLVADRTNIPLPRIIAYGSGDESKPIHTFLILEYVHGKTLDTSKVRGLPAEQKQTLYESLADIYIQLRRLEFSSIGCLTGRQDPTVGGPRTVFTIDINNQVMSNNNPLQIQEKYMRNPQGGLQSAADYTQMLLDLGDNALQACTEVSAEQVYNMHVFRKFALGWLKPEFDQGPFLLTHGDFDGRNILIDETYNIVAVLDWEWGHVVPLQFFIPPLWLDTPSMTMMSRHAWYWLALKEYDVFLAIVRSREQVSFGSDNISLADEWEVVKPDGGFFIPYALENWCFMDWFAHYSIHFHRGDELERRIEEFMSEDERRRQAVKTPANANDVPTPKAPSTTIWAQVENRFQGACSKLLASWCYSNSSKAITLSACGTATACMAILFFRWWNQRP